MRKRRTTPTPKKKTAPKKKRRSLLFRTIWVVQVDHSLAGIWRTRREAERAASLHRKHPDAGLDPFVIGPYKLQPRARRRAAVSR